jgi:hypothetical protein
MRQVKQADKKKFAEVLYLLEITRQELDEALQVFNDAENKLTQARAAHEKARVLSRQVAQSIQAMQTHGVPPATSTDATNDTDQDRGTGDRGGPRQSRRSSRKGANYDTSRVD